MPARLNGSTSGYTELTAPPVAGNNTLILPTGNGSLDQVLGGNGAGALGWVDRGRMVLATAQNSTSGTSIDFTGIPSWVKKILVQFNGVSTSGTSNIQIQIGSGTFTTSGYTSNCHTGNTSNSGTVTSGFIMTAVTMNVVTYYGISTIALMGSNTYVESHSLGGTSDYAAYGGGGVALSGVLDRVRITTVNGTDTFDAGTINLLLEG